MNLKPFLAFFYPQYCLLCGTRQKLCRDNSLCQSCRNDLQVITSPCIHCGLPLQHPQTGEHMQICAQCLQSPPVFDRCWSPFVYAEPFEWMIRQFKFNAKLAFAPMLSGLLIEALSSQSIESAGIDVVMPMPLHPNRLRQRGFNQSLLLAKSIADFLGVPVDSDSCIRIRDTDHQTGKTAAQRQRNIKGAFKFNNQKYYEHILVIDDVVTTGSSIAELSRTLKKQGVLQVDVWSLARAKKIS